MEKEFIPYELALELKELGFDEEFLDKYIPTSQKLSSDMSTWGEFYPESAMIPAPLYQQAFRWFREKYFLHVPIMVKEGVWYFDKFSTKGYKTYEEAELECLKEMIEIIKNK